MDIQNMNVKQLKALARERGIKGYYKLRKAELQDALGDKLHSTTGGCNPKQLYKSQLRKVSTAQH